jgi:hypothetical protein
MESAILYLFTVDTSYMLEGLGLKLYTQSLQYDYKGAKGAYDSVISSLPSRRTASVSEVLGKKQLWHVLKLLLSASVVTSIGIEIIALISLVSPV